MEQDSSDNSDNIVYEIAPGLYDRSTENLDVLAIARLSRSIPGMRHALAEDPRFPFESPCLLHSDPYKWPQDRDAQGTNSQVMPLDAPSIHASVPCNQTGPGQKHWVGGNGEWVAIVQDLTRWYLLNVYTNVQIEVPSVQNVGIHYHNSPFVYHHDMAHIRLIKMATQPHLVVNKWMYDLIAVFDKCIAIMRGGRDVDWTILRNEFLAPSRYVDAIMDVQRIYAVTEPKGDVLVWEPTVWGADALPRLIRSPVIPELLGALLSGDEDGPHSWFLATGHRGDVSWVHVRGKRIPQGDPLYHMTRNLLTYPSLRCYVFARDGHGLDPLPASWVRQTDLQGNSLFLGINYPFMLHVPDRVGANAAHALPVLKKDCVFATHTQCNQHPKPNPDWYRMTLSAGPPIGSSLNYAEPDWGELIETPMWTIPVFPQG